ncbi:hypothetical protein F8158_30635 [Bacillus cereus]|uniref:Group-specific protein n=2 Tax=Bacillus cereus TaxID=1396 RepID=A0AB34CWJ7_BACCE|nr:hypothetical protein F8158_30635 [Bacillus cereus]
MQDEELQKEQQRVLDFGRLIKKQLTIMDGVQQDFNTIEQDLSTMINSALAHDKILVEQLFYFDRLCKKIKSQI